MSEVAKMKQAKKPKNTPSHVQACSEQDPQQLETIAEKPAIVYDYSDSVKQMEAARLELEAQIVAAKKGIIDDIRLIMDRFNITEAELRASLEADMVAPV